MNETLAHLLLRLSEADGQPVLWGRAAKPYHGSLFNQLLANGTLIEEAPADLWPVCPDCDCGYDDRQIQRIDGRIIAACPFDAGRDAILDEDDLRSFVIDEQRLVGTIATDNPHFSPREVIPGLWHLGASNSGRAVFLTLKRSVSNDPGLLAVMRTTAHGRKIILIAPKSTEHARQRLDDAGDVHAILPVQALKSGDASFLDLDMAALEPAGGVIRLVIIQSSKAVILDGVEIPVPAQPYILLELFAKRAKEGNGVISLQDIEKKCGRIARDIVRDLRKVLKKYHPDPESISNLTRNIRALPGYQLCLEPEQIEIRV